MNIALGSLSELETQYLISLRLNLLKKNEIFEKLMTELKKLLIGFRNHLKKFT
ncbi:MAG: four helix bundle protein [Bacteroidota bacterium]